MKKLLMVVLPFGLLFQSVAMGMDKESFADIEQRLFRKLGIVGNNVSDGDEPDMAARMKIDLNVKELEQLGIWYNTIAWAIPAYADFEKHFDTLVKRVELFGVLSHWSLYHGHYGFFICFQQQLRRLFSAKTLIPEYITSRQIELIDTLERASKKHSHLYDIFSNLNKLHFEHVFDNELDIAQKNTRMQLQKLIATKKEIPRELFTELKRQLLVANTLYVLIEKIIQPKSCEKQHENFAAVVTDMFPLSDHLIDSLALLNGSQLVQIFYDDKGNLDLDLLRSTYSLLSNIDGLNYLHQTECNSAKAFYLATGTRHPDHSASNPSTLLKVKISLHAALRLLGQDVNAKSPSKSPAASNQRKNKSSADVKTSAKIVSIPSTKLAASQVVSDQSGDAKKAPQQRRVVTAEIVVPEFPPHDESKDLYLTKNISSRGKGRGAAKDRVGTAANNKKGKEPAKPNKKGSNAQASGKNKPKLTPPAAAVSGNPQPVDEKNKGEDWRETPAPHYEKSTKLARPIDFAEREDDKVDQEIWNNADLVASWTTMNDHAEKIGALIDQPIDEQRFFELYFHLYMLSEAFSDFVVASEKDLHVKDLFMSTKDVGVVKLRNAVDKLVYFYNNDAAKIIFKEAAEEIFFDFSHALKVWQKRLMDKNSTENYLIYNDHFSAKMKKLNSLLEQIGDGMHDSIACCSLGDLTQKYSKIAGAGIIALMGTLSGMKKIGDGEVIEQIEKLLVHYDESVESLSIPSTNDEFEIVLTADK